MRKEMGWVGGEGMLFAQAGWGGLVRARSEGSEGQVVEYSVLMLSATLPGFFVFDFCSQALGGPGSGCCCAQVSHAYGK